ncbi:MAG: ParB/RepB/Spo0J family partition protein [Candidatus Helarchaeota archaeon]|nr:ParB/RepB/Spo0J family partition protein [Candidatus Helarchaeota archaeon]
MPEYREIPLNKLVPSDNPIRSFPLDVEELKDSIMLDGILQPIIVQYKDDMYEIVSGYRRYNAAKLIYPPTQVIPCMVMDTPLHADEASFLSAIENVQRVELNPIERGEWVLRMLKAGYTYKEIANRLGKSESTIKRWKDAAETAFSVKKVYESMSPQEEKTLEYIVKSAGKEEPMKEIIEPYEIPSVTLTLIGQYTKDEKKQAEIATTVQAYDLSMDKTQQMLDSWKATPEKPIHEIAQNVKESIYLTIVIPGRISDNVRNFSKEINKSAKETIEWIIEKIMTKDNILNMLKREL